MEGPGRISRIFAASLVAIAGLGSLLYILDLGGYGLNYVSFFFASDEQLGVSTFGHDDRRELTWDEDRAHAAIGFFGFSVPDQRAAYFLGSGFLMLRSDIVLTSAHLFYAPDGRATVPQDRLLFYPSGQTYISIPVKNIWSGTTAPTQLNLEEDWALVQLSARIEGAERYLYRGFVAPNPDEHELVHVAFHGDQGIQARFLKRISDCQGQALPERRLLLHHCDASAGSSGSPLLVARDGAFEVEGIHSRVSVGRHGDDWEPNLAILIDKSLADRIAEIVAQLPSK